jgi:hypothetical protein
MTAESFSKERLCSLIRLLSTPIDGERLAVVYGIERILTAAGLSFHDLAIAIHKSPLEINEEGHAANSWIEAGQKLLKAGGLTEHETKFVTDIVRRFSMNPAFIPSDKQTNWFVSLYKRRIAA